MPRSPHGLTRRSALSSAALLAAAGLASAGDGDAPQHAIGDVPWDARAVEHLFSRAAFGIPASEVEARVHSAPEVVVDQLLDGGRAVEPFPATRLPIGHQRRVQSAPEAEREGMKKSLRADDRRQMEEYGRWWVERMLDGVDPLRDRMTLFWHGFFTTNARELRRNYEVVRQQLFVREHALESYAELLTGIVRDPAMLYYLDNTSNQAGNPNENLARELMELFSLGVGNYTEEDVREVARALTGFTADRDGNFEFDAKVHDAGTKTILGETGAFDGDDVVRILLGQKACAEHVVRRLVTYLEGAAPDEARVREYAAILRENDYRLRPLLRALFLDPRFYRDDVVGTRVLAPVEFVVGTAHRLGLRPSARFVIGAADSLGQTLFEPPNVKGWEEGEAWITTASLLQRGNVAGMMLGAIDLEEAFTDAPAMEMASEESMQADRNPRAARQRGAARTEPSMEPSMEPAMQASGELPKELRGLEKDAGSDFGPPINLTWRVQQAGARTDAEIVEALLPRVLAIDPAPVRREPLVQFVRAQRELLEIQEGRLLDQPDASEDVLRRLAHLILSLPEAQLD